jgi:hypothetical protein
MESLTDLFKDKYEFFNIGTICCIIIMALIFITDYFTSIAINLLGGSELNPIMAYFITHPFIFAFIKILSMTVIICISKIMYDMIQGYHYSKFNIVSVYITLSIPSGLTLAMVINNFGVLL